MPFMHGVEQANMTEIGQLLAEILQFEHLNFRALGFGQKLCHTGALIRSNLWHHTAKPI